MVGMISFFYFDISAYGRQQQDSTAQQVSTQDTSTDGHTMITQSHSTYCTTTEALVC